MSVSIKTQLRSALLFSGAIILSLLVAGCSTTGSSSAYDCKGQEITECLANQIVNMDLAGFAGQDIKPESKQLNLYIKGSIPNQLNTLVANNQDVTIKIRSAVYSKKEMDVAQNKFVKFYPPTGAKKGIIVASVGGKEDGSGLLIGLYVTSDSPTEKWLAEVGSKVGMPVFVNPERSSEIVLG